MSEYLPEEDKDWLQANRIELNAMATPQFIQWLTVKVTTYFRSKRPSAKVVPAAAGQRSSSATMDAASGDSAVLVS